MENSDKIIILAFICLIAITGFTVWNISRFTPALDTCNDEFDLINYCGCVPCDSGVVKMFHAEKQCKFYVENISALEEFKSNG